MENETSWEKNVLEKLAMETLAEQKRRRRWGIFFRLLGFAYFGIVLWMIAFPPTDKESFAPGESYTALISIDGAISSETEASAERTLRALQNAYKNQSIKGIVLRINSPGGSPVQAGIINDEIYRLRATRPDLPIVTVVEDICASGGYYIAAATDKIYVDKASLVGSIGVIMNGFGFVDSLEKLGVERRLLTAGENKGFLDPFSPQDEEQVAFAKTMLENIHEQFIAVVRKGRGERLKETPEIFSGLIWTGEQSIELGLADEFGSVDSVARDVFKAEKVRDFTQKRSFAERFAQQFGSDVAEGVKSSLHRVPMQ